MNLKKFLAVFFLAIMLFAPSLAPANAQTSATTTIQDVQTLTKLILSLQKQVKALKADLKQLKKMERKLVRERVAGRNNGGSLGAATSEITVTAVIGTGETVIDEEAQERNDKGWVYFETSEKIDGAHIFIDKGNGQPGGMDIGKAKDGKFVYSNRLSPGKYEYTFTARKGKERTVLTGTLTVPK